MDLWLHTLDNRDTYIPYYCHKLMPLIIQPTQETRMKSFQPMKRQRWLNALLNRAYSGHVLAEYAWIFLC